MAKYTYYIERESTLRLISATPQPPYGGSHREANILSDALGAVRDSLMAESCALPHCGLLLTRRTGQPADGLTNVHRNWLRTGQPADGFTNVHRNWLRTGLTTTWLRTCVLFS